MSARANLSTLLGDTFEIKEIAILEPSLLVETDSTGRTNVEALLEAIGSSEDSAPETASNGQSADRPGIVIGSFVLENGTVRYVTPGEPPMVVKNLNVRVDDFDPAAAFPLTVSLDLFEEEAVHLTYSGHSGPFRPDSSPANGALSIEALPARLPEQFRIGQLGDFIVSPGAAGRLNLDVELSGDLLDDFSGQGHIRFTGIRLGKAAEKQLPLQGEAPVSLTIRNALANPSWLLKMSEATLQLGSGAWTGTKSLAKAAAVDQAKSFLGGLLRRRSSEPTANETAAEGEQPSDEAAEEGAAEPRKKLPFGLGDALNKALGGKQEPSEEASTEPKPEQ